MKLSIIIINYNTPEMTARAIDCLRRDTSSLDAEVILIDNDSAAKLSAEQLENLKIDKYIDNHENLGFARAVNQGLKAAEGEYVFLLNSDAFVHAGSIERAVGYLDYNPAVAIAGFLMHYPDGEIQVSCGRFPNLIREFLRFSKLYKIIPAGTIIHPKHLENSERRGVPKWSPQEPQQVDWVSGGAMMIRKKALAELGAFDPAFFFGIEDWDMCYRARQAGWQVAYLPDAPVEHRHGFSSGGRRSTWSMEEERKGSLHFWAKHYPEKRLARQVVSLFYKIKIFVVKLVY